MIKLSISWLLNAFYIELSLFVFFVSFHFFHSGIQINAIASHHNVKIICWNTQRNLFIIYNKLIYSSTHQHKQTHTHRQKQSDGSFKHLNCGKSCCYFSAGMWDKFLFYQFRSTRMCDLCEYSDNFRGLRPRIFFNSTFESIFDAIGYLCVLLLNIHHAFSIWKKKRFESILLWSC